MGRIYPTKLEDVLLDVCGARGTLSTREEFLVTFLNRPIYRVVAFEEVRNLQENLEMKPVWANKDFRVGIVVGRKKPEISSSCPDAIPYGFVKGESQQITILYVDNSKGDKE